MIKAICFGACAVAIMWAGSGPLSAETAQPFGTKTPGTFSPIIQLVQNCKPDGKSCKTNDQCCSGNCQKATGMPKGTCLHGD